MKRVYCVNIARITRNVASALIFHNLFYQIEKAKIQGKTEEDGRYWVLLPLSELEQRFQELSIQNIRTALKKLEESGLVDIKLTSLKDKKYSISEKCYILLEEYDDLEWMETEAYLSLSGKPKIIDKEPSKKSSVKKSFVKKDENKDTYSSVGSQGSSLLDFPTSELRINGKTIDEMFEDMKNDK